MKKKEPGTRTSGTDLLSLLEASIRNKPEAILAFKTERTRLCLSDALKKIRTGMGLSQQELATRMGRQQSWISKLESPNNDHTLESIAEYLFTLGAEFRLSVNMAGLDMGIIDSSQDAHPSLHVSLPSFLSVAKVSELSEVLRGQVWDRAGLSRRAAEDTAPPWRPGIPRNPDEFWGEAGVA